MLTDDEILKMLNPHGWEYMSGATRSDALVGARKIEAATLRAKPLTEDLLREARDELLWWINEHGCCAGHEGDLIDRIDAVVGLTPSAASPRS